MNWNWKEDLKRGMAGLLAFTMASLLVVGDTGTVLAGLSAGGLLRDGVSLSEDSDISDSLVDSVTFENQENDGVLISVSSDDSDFQPGDDVTLHIYVKNESDETITGGILSYDGDGIQKGTGDLTLLGKLDSRDLLSQLLVESDETEDADLIWDLDEDSDAVILASENDWEWEEDIEAERDGITLEPGEIYVAQFEYVVDKSADGKTAEGFQIDFRFEGIGEDEDEIEAEETFSFTTNYLNVMAPEFEDGNLVKTGETIEMGLHANLAQADSVLTDSWEDASASDAEEAEEDVSVATPSQATAAASSTATTATASNASASTTVSVATPSQASAAKKATASDAVASDSDADEADATVDEELIDDRESMLTEVDLSEVRYEVEMYNAKLNGFKVKKAMVEDAENNMLVCTYRVSKEVEPGIYFGKVTQISEANGHTYESTQGFALIVEGDGDVTLEGSLGDTTVTVTGPVDAFPDADELEVRVTELDEETQLKVEEAIQRKAEEAGETLQNYIAMDVSLYADGEEIQPGERVEVTIAYDEEALTGTIATDEMEAADDALSESTTIKKAVYHFDEGSQEAEILDGSIEDGTATVTTMGFSPIVVAASLTASSDQGTLGSVLDGDYAYLSDVAMVADDTTESGYSMRTGTASWDADDSTGNDSCDTNNILRTYDIATYTVTFTSRTRNDAPYKTYETGTLYFEFILEGDSSEVQFETGSMGWLTAKKDAQYYISEEMIDGETCQVLRGSYTWEPSDSSDHAIGESTQELTLAIRALALTNGDTIQPTFTFFLEGNDVGVDYSDWGTEEYTGGVVTGSGNTCDEHSEAEYQTITAPEITVSARASYNVAIVSASTSKCQSVGTFDFSTGNDLALNQDAGEVYGRMGAYGIIIQIKELSSGQGLKGVELPKSGEDITFNLSLDSTFTYTDENGTSHKLSLSDGTLDSAYTPLIWSFDANITGTSSTQQDERVIPVSTKCADTAPLNKLGETTTAYSYNSCYDGGTWRIKQNSDGTYTVTVSNCVVDMSQIPYTNQAGNVNSTTYYNSANVENYWEIGTACISAGEMWIVQPFYETDEDTPSGTTGTYIVDEYGDGTFTTVLSDTSLSMTTASGSTLATVTDNSNQAVTSDDKVSQSMAITKPGTISQQIQYLKYNYNAYNDPLTDGCWGTGQDWILVGDNLTIGGWVSHDSAEGGYTGVAYDVLIKFDDAFFEPTSVSASGVNGGTVTVMYAAKSDRSGWEHNGLDPNESGYDTDMIYADIDDLVYFSRVDDLEDAGYTCVGVLLQYRGLVTEQMNHIHYYIKGSCKSDVEVDYVYMVTHCCRVWNREELAEASGTSLSDLLAMTTSEVNALVKTYIPTVSDSSTPDYSSYPTTYWVNGGEDGVGTQSDNIRNYTKPYYDDNGYVSQTEGYLWGDSCLVVGYTSNVTLNVAQTTSSGGTKSSYDMDTNQRTVDYVVQGSIIRNNGTFTTDTTQQTTVTMTVTLPDGLSYLEGSSYIGGTYTSNGEGIQGTVTDGTPLTEDGTVTYTDEYGNEVSVTLTIGKDADGNTTLTYTVAGYTIGSDATEYLDKIYFSCTIGTAGIEETDVKNNDSLVTSVTIETTEDCNREFNTENANYAETGILISKNSAISLVKFADQSVVDVGDEMGFTMNVGNNGNNALSIVAVDALPYQGESASFFTGNVIVTEFSVTSQSTADLDDLTFYYTDSDDYQGITSESITNKADYSENSYFTDTNGWSKLTLTQTKTLVCDNEDVDHTHTDADCYEVSYVATWEVSDDFQPTAIVAVGTLAANTTLKMHITILLPGAKEGEYITNTLSRGNLSSTARCRTVNRTLSGLAWIDVDGDGYQDSDESTIDGVMVALLKLKDGLDDTDSEIVNNINNYEAVCYTDTDTAIVISTGQQIDVLRATGADDTFYITDYTVGNYLFNNLSAGTYAVKFYTSKDDEESFRFIDESTGEIYWSSPQDADGADDTKDSDAEGIYVDSDNAQSEGLQYTLIMGIEMPEASELEYATYSSPNHDSGVYKPVKRLRVVKYVYANGEKNEPIPSEYKFLIDIDRVSGDDEITVLDDYTTFALGTTEDISRYIDLDGEKGGTTFKLEEIVPMEYSLEEMIWIDTPETETEQNALTALLTADDGGNMASQVLGSYKPVTVDNSKVTIYPGDDITVILTNQPVHTSYFHHTASVTNSNTTKGTSGFSSIKDYDEDTDSESTTSVTTLSMADVKIVALVDYRMMKRRMDDQEGGDWNEAI